MRDEKIGRLFGFLYTPQQVENGAAQGDIERRNRLVQHDQRRSSRKRPRNRDALALPTGNLMDAAPCQRRIKPDRLQKAGNIALQPMNAQRFAQKIIDARTWIEGREGS